MLRDKYTQMTAEWLRGAEEDGTIAKGRVAGVCPTCDERRTRVKVGYRIQFKRLKLFPVWDICPNCGGLGYTIIQPGYIPTLIEGD